MQYYVRVGRLGLLIGGSRDLPARQQTLWNTIGWSYDLLDAGAQTLFARLAVFVGGCTLEAAEAVTVAGGESVLDELTALVDHNMLGCAETAEGERRFTMLETIREYALERLLAGGEAEAVRRRHATAYLALAEAAEPALTGAEQVVWLARLEAEHDNLRAALGWALERGEVETAWRLGGALWRFWMIRGYLSEGRRWLAAALAEGSDGPAAIRAKALHGAGVLARQQGDLLRAAARYEECLALRRDLGDKRGIAVVLGHLGVLAYDRGDFDRAAALHGESLALRRALEDSWGVALTLNNLGEVTRQRGDEECAVVLYEESLALFRDLGDRYGLAMALMNLGMVVHHRGDFARATALLEESLALWQALGEKGNIAECLEGLAGVAAGQGQADRTARLGGAAEALRDTVGVPLSPADRARYEQHLAAARAHSDAATFAAAWVEGRTYTLEQAIAYAINRGDRSCCCRTS